MSDQAIFLEKRLPGKKSHADFVNKDMQRDAWCWSRRQVWFGVLVSRLGSGYTGFILASRRK